MTPDFERIDVARDDRMQRRDDVGADQHRVDALVRSGGMAALAGDLDVDAVARGQQRAGADGELADGDARHVVHAVDLLDAPALHQAVVHHGLAAGAALLGRLEDDDGGAVEVARLAQILGGAQQHGRVPVVAAGVHVARRLGGVGQAGDLRHGQRVHVGAHADHLARGGLATPDDADHARPADAGHHLVAAECLELVGDDPGRAVHVVEHLRVLMDVAAPARRPRPAWRRRG